MRTLIILSMLIMMSGCSLFSVTGNTNYSFEPIMDEQGKVISYRVSVSNSKDYESLKFKLKKSKTGDIEIRLDEVGVSASDPNKVNAENTGKLLDMAKTIIPTIKGN